MKHSSLILATLLLAASAFADPYIRSIRNSVIDLTAAYTAGPGSAYSNYWVSGQIKDVYAKCVVVAVPDGYRLMLDPSRASDTLSLLVASRMAPNGDIPIGQYLTLSPSMQAMFVRRMHYHDIVLLNCDTLAIRIGEKIRVCGLDCGHVSLTGTQILNLPSFDCGTPFQGIPGTNFYSATLQGLKRATNSVTLLAK